MICPAIGALSNYLRSGFSQRSAPCWCTDLIIDHFYHFSFCDQFHHRQEEVLATRTIYPGSAKDDVTTPSISNRFITCQFASSVGRERVGLIFFGVRALLGAVENVVC